MASNYITQCIGGLPEVYERLFHVLCQRAETVSILAVSSGKGTEAPRITWTNATGDHAITLLPPEHVSLVDWQKRFDVVINGDEEIIESGIEFPMGDVATTSVRRNFTEHRFALLLLLIEQADKRVIR